MINSHESIVPATRGRRISSSDSLFASSSLNSGATAAVCRAGVLLVGRSCGNFLMSTELKSMPDIDSSAA